jgi:hypothetical protein
MSKKDVQTLKTHRGFIADLYKGRMAPGEDCEREDCESAFLRYLIRSAIGTLDGANIGSSEGSDAPSRV